MKFYLYTHKVSAAKNLRICWTFFFSFSKISTHKLLSVPGEFLKTMRGIFRMIPLINAIRSEMEARLALNFSGFLRKAFPHLPGDCLRQENSPRSSFLWSAIAGCLTWSFLFFVGLLEICYQHSVADISLFSRLYCFNPSPFHPFLTAGRVYLWLQKYRGADFLAVTQLK